MRRKELSRQRKEKPSKYKPVPGVSNEVSVERNQHQPQRLATNHHSSTNNIHTPQPRYKDKDIGAATLADYMGDMTHKGSAASEARNPGSYPSGPRGHADMYGRC